MVHTRGGDGGGGGSGFSGGKCGGGGDGKYIHTYIIYIRWLGGVRARRYY